MLSLFIQSIEELTGEKAIVPLSKTEGGDAGIKIPVLSGGISTRTKKRKKKNF